MAKCAIVATSLKSGYIIYVVENDDGGGGDDDDDNDVPALFKMSV